MTTDALTSREAMLVDLVQRLHEQLARRHGIVVEVLELGVLEIGGLVPPAAELLEQVVADHCRLCGCTQDAACEGGCGWAAEELCTSCVEVAQLLAEAGL
jgi:hypothetical protein